MPDSDQRGEPGRVERLPLGIEGLTAGWLGGVLGHRHPGTLVETLQVRRVMPGHTTKVLVDVTLNQAGQDAGLPTRLCLKTNWSGDTLSSRVCANEARFYRTLAGPLSLPVPRCHLADWDDDADGQQGLLVLDDLSDTGVRFAGISAAIGLDDAAASLARLAAIHGSTWDHPELSRQPWLERAMQAPTDDYWSMMEDVFAANNRRPERLALFPDWMAKDPTIVRRMLAQLRAHDLAVPGPLCLLHGDAHLGNTYIDEAGNRSWCDWQIARKGHPWRDYSYFLVGALSVEDRRSAERDLLQHYLGALKTYGVEYDFDEAWDEYRRWVVWCFPAWQGNINPMLDTMPPLERFGRAAEDLDLRALYRV